MHLGQTAQSLGYGGISTWPCEGFHDTHTMVLLVVNLTSPPHTTTTLNPIHKQLMGFKP